ncbi:hypothetical protein HYC85_032361 [Camellia sinensis]|uniref:Potassium channel n=1 Tax=Camellia sinensis TaxID=4442 RepID=A0A7J7FUZ2_CAMSI|nr:hypothetical protein HYC85_032361 [Camellia sinensis]
MSFSYAKNFLQLFSEDGFQKGIGCPNGFFSSDVLIPSLGATWISPFEFAFLGYKQDVLFIINYIVNGFFATDIILTFFVAYLDTQTYILVDNPKELQSEYYPPKEDVILQNEAPTDLYILVSGAVIRNDLWWQDLIAHIDGHGQAIGKAVAGDVSGEIGVLCHMPQPFTVRTTEISQILGLDSSILMNIIQANTEHGHIIMNILFKV